MHNINRNIFNKWLGKIKRVIFGQGCVIITNIGSNYSKECDQGNPKNHCGSL